jgi:hypothetical protein
MFEREIRNLLRKDARRRALRDKRQISNIRYERRRRGIEQTPIIGDDWSKLRTLKTTPHTGAKTNDDE